MSTLLGVVNPGELGVELVILFPPLIVPVDLLLGNSSRLSGLRAPLRCPGGLGIAKLSLDLSNLDLLGIGVFSGVPFSPLSPGVFRGFSSFLEVRLVLDKLGEDELNALVLDSLILSLLDPEDPELLELDLLFMNIPVSADPVSLWSPFSNTISVSESLTPFRPAAPPLLDRLTSLS